MGSVTKSIGRTDELAVLPYLVAAITTLAALGLRILLDPVLRDQATYLTFLLAILAASRFGGFRPGMLATALSAVALDWFCLEPYTSLAISSSKAMAGLTLFCLAGVVISLVVGRLRQSLINSRNAGISPKEPAIEQLEDAAVRTSAVGVFRDMFRANELRRRPHLVWLGFAIFLVATEGILFYGTWTRLSDRERLSIETRQVLERIGSVFSTLQDAETGQRGYLLSGRAAYLKPYSDALGQISSQLDELRRLTSDNLEQQNRIGELRGLVAARLEELRATIELRKTAGAEAALESVQNDSGKNLMDRIRGEIATLRAAELSLLDERDRSLSNAARGMVVIMVSGVGLLLVVLLAGSRAIDGQIAKRTKYENNLRAAEERFRIAQEASPDGFNILQPVRDREGRIIDFTFLYQNPTSARRAGNEPDAVLGRTLCELYPSFRGSQFEGIYREVADGGETRILEAPFDFGDRSPVWLRAAVMRMGQDLAVLTQDITERKRNEAAIQETSAQLEAIIEAIPEPVTVSDSTGTFILSNAAFKAAIPPEPKLGDYLPYAELRQEDGRVLAPEDWPLNRAIRGERLNDLHLWLRFNDAPARLYRYSTNSICDGNGNVTHAIVCQIDTTERNRAEERLRASEEKFAKAFAVNPAAVAMTRVEDGLFMDVNTAWEAMNGYGREEVVGHVVKDFHMWPETKDRDGFTAELYEKGAIQGREQVFLKKSGEPYTALFSAVVVNVGGDQVVLSTLLDATEQKKASEALHQLNQQLEQRVEERTAQLVEAGAKVRAERQRLLDMLDTLPVIVAIIRQDYRVEWTNRAYRQALGDNAGQLCYMGQFGGNEPCDECEAFVPLATGQPHNWEWTLPDGRTFDIYNFPFVAGDGTPAVLEMDLDITERRRAEEVLRDLNAALEQRVAERTAELRASEKLFRTLANAIPQLCWTANADGWVDWYNERWYQYTGTTPQDMEGWGWQSVHDPEALPAVVGRWQASLATGEPFDMVFPLRGGDGGFRPFLTRVMPLLDGDGKVARWFGTNTDITEQRKAEEALRAQADLLRLSFDAIILWRLDGVIESWNVGAERLYGYSESEAVGQVTHDLLATVFPKPWREIRAELLANDTWEGELRHRTYDGEEVIVSARKQLFRDANGVARILEANRDITSQTKAHDALLTSNSRFRGIFENSAAGIMLADWGGNLLESNDAFCGLLGYQRDELKGRHFGTLIPLPDQELNVADVRRLKNGEIPYFQNESRYLRKDGEAVWVHKFVSLIPDVSGQAPNVVALVTDISERKRAEAAFRESEQRYRGLFESMQEAFLLGEVIFDEAGNPCDWRYLDVNPYFEAIYGRKREEVVGKTYRSVLPGTHSEQWIEIAGRVTLTGKGEVFASKSNTGLYLEGTVYRPRPGQFAAIITDATARREAENQIRRLNTDLEDRVRDRTAQLEAANRELEVFSYSVSHDLRSPLRGIDGWSLALVEDYANQLDEQAREYLDRVRSEAQRMGLLIDDMLQLSRITRAQMEKRPVDLTAVATAVARRLGESQPDRRIEFVIPAALSGRGDAGLLEIALTNLLGNSVKFTGQREDARIELGTAEIDGERAFFVRDNGVVFNMASAGKLFGAFQRLHKASQFPGTGIGLATVQRIIHRHGGRVWAHAERGKGATFYFTLDSK